MLAIRMSRFGKKKEPLFRLIVNEKTKDPWGDYKESLGHYNPRTKVLTIDADKVKRYIEQGAQPSNSVLNLLITNGVIEGKKKPVSHLTTKRRKKMADELAAQEEAKRAAEEAAAAEKAAAEEAAAAAEAAPEAETPAEATSEEAPAAAPEEPAA